jgi:hypothetical protein
MIIHNFNVICVSLTPLKTDTPPIINADTVLTFAVAVELLEPI